MHSVCLAGLLAFLLLASSGAMAAPALDAAIEREHGAGRFDGMVLVGRGDQVTYRRAIGLADRARRLPHRHDDVWRWASVSKQVAALLVMQQVEQGRLSLESRLDEVLPGFASPQAARISLRMLLQHTSGLPNPDSRPGFYLAQFKDEAGPLNAALAFCAGPPATEPGSRFAYNNCDTLVLQAVLGKATGQSYAGLLASAVAAPLQTRKLSMAAAARGKARPATAIGYLETGRAESPFNLASFGAAGAMMGTADDLWRFDRALMQQRLLGAAATRTMWTGEPALGYAALGAWVFEAPLAGCAAPVRLVERRGQIGAVQVRNLLAPELGAALIVFSNAASTEFGEIWQGQGLTHELASAAFCAAGPGMPAAKPASAGAVVTR